MRFAKPDLKGDKPPPLDLILDVVALRSEFQMARIHTKAVVAPMPNNRPVMTLTLWNGAVGKLKCEPVSQDFPLTAPAAADDAIATSAALADPRPAFIGTATVHVLRESLL